MIINDISEYTLLSYYSVTIRELDISMNYLQCLHRFTLLVLVLYRYYYSISLLQRNTFTYE